MLGCRRAALRDAGVTAGELAGCKTPPVLQAQLSSRNCLVQGMHPQLNNQWVCLVKWQGLVCAQAGRGERSCMLHGSRTHVLELERAGANPDPTCEATAVVV